MGLCSSSQAITNTRNPVGEQKINVDAAKVSFNYGDKLPLNCNKQTVQLKVAWDMFEGVPSVDLDAQAVMFNSKGKFLEGCFFNNLSACNGAVTHSGDQRDGSADGWDEVLTLDLEKAADSAQIIALCVCAFNEGSSFEQVETARAELHSSDGTKLASVNLVASSTETSCVVLLMYYDMNSFEWVFRSVGGFSKGRNFRDALPVIRRAIGDTLPSIAPMLKQHSDSDANKLQFFKDVASCNVNRDYVIIVDRSGSMGGSNWTEAKRAVTFLAPHVVKADPDGISLYFFDHNVSSYHKVNSAKKVQEIFNKEAPCGSTALSKVLDKAFRKRKGETTMLIITDGSPDSATAVEARIIKETKKMKTDGELSLSFIQVGSSSTAAKWLKKLDDDLESHGAKFDIVDMLTANELKGVGFNKMIENSIND